MPRDLFGDVVMRPRAVRSRQPPVLIVSIAAHAAVLLAILVVSAVAPDMLPTPRQALAFYEPERVLDIALPPPPPRPRASDKPQALPSVAPNAAPVVAPDTIAPETGLEGIAAPASSPIAGIETGIGADTVGFAEAPPPAPPLVPAAAPVRLHSGIKAPVKVNDVMPLYPTLARDARVQGVVILEAVVDASGRVESARVLRSIPTLDEAALDAVRQWRFTPALLNGEPVPVVMTVTVRFTLE
jgi:protein TonB